MFPPERTATTGPLPPTRSASSAATGAAPAPSTTSFVRSSRRTIAWLISSSLTTTMSSSDVAQDRRGQLARMLDRDALRDREAADLTAGERRERCRLHAHQARVRLHRPDRKRDAGGEPASADRDDHRLEVGNLLQELQTDRSLSRDHLLVLEGVEEGRVLGLGVVERGGERLLERLAVQLRLRTVVPRRFDLRHRRVVRHEDAREHAGLARRPGNRLAVVARARGDDAGGVLLRAQKRDLVDRAADLESAGALEVLGLRWTGRPVSRENVSEL